MYNKIVNNTIYMREGKFKLSMSIAGVYSLSNTLELIFGVTNRLMKIKV